MKSPSESGISAPPKHHLPLGSWGTWDRPGASKRRRMARGGVDGWARGKLRSQHDVVSCPNSPCESRRNICEYCGPRATKLGLASVPPRPGALVHQPLQGRTSASDAGLRTEAATRPDASPASEAHTRCPPKAVSQQ